MTPYSLDTKLEIMCYVGKKKVSEIAKGLNKNPKSIYEWIRKHNIKINRRLTETELYILENFGANKAKEFIQDKSLNALRIAECRLRKKATR